MSLSQLGHLMLLILLFFSCKKGENEISSFKLPSDHLEFELPINDITYNKIYTQVNIDKEIFPKFDENVLKGVRWQRKLFEIKRRGKKNFNVDGLKFTQEDLERTVDALENWGHAALVPPSEYFNTYIISGEEKKGEVLFTGYFSPVLEVNRVQDAVFKYPIYAKPQGDGPFPTRKEIYDEGALIGKDLELAYARSLLDIQSMQLQGSGFVKYRDGKRFLFSYGGSNGHPRKSIQRYFLNNYGEKGQGITLKKLEKYFSENPDKQDEIIYHNPSYIFFEKNEKRKTVNGSGNVPLIPQVSIATDKRIIPTGACLFAERPLPSKNNLNHVPSILLAQDVGGAIKGARHVDLYTGIGKEARKKAALSHYGKIWFLLAK